MIEGESGMGQKNTVEAVASVGAVEEVEPEERVGDVQSIPGERIRDVEVNEEEVREDEYRRNLFLELSSSFLESFLPALIRANEELLVQSPGFSPNAPQPVEFVSTVDAQTADSGGVDSSPKEGSEALEGKEESRCKASCVVSLRPMNEIWALMPSSQMGLDSTKSTERSEKLLRQAPSQTGTRRSQTPADGKKLKSSTNRPAKRSSSATREVGADELGGGRSIEDVNGDTTESSTKPVAPEEIAIAAGDSPGGSVGHRGGRGRKGKSFRGRSGGVATRVVSSGDQVREAVHVGSGEKANQEEKKPADPENSPVKDERKKSPPKKSKGRGRYKGIAQRRGDGALANGSAATVDNVLPTSGAGIDDVRAAEAAETSVVDVKTDDPLAVPSAMTPLIDVNVDDSLAAAAATAPVRDVMVDDPQAVGATISPVVDVKIDNAPAVSADSNPGSAAATPHPWKPQKNFQMDSRYQYREYRCSNRGCRMWTMISNGKDIQCRQCGNYSRPWKDPALKHKKGSPAVGTFKCPENNCGNEWISPRAYVGYPQCCNICGYPTFAFKQALFRK